jgi:squalene-hopene cyclase-like protein
VIPWRIAVFVLLGLVLAGGLAWYERSKPPSRTVALVAALAALAVAGRLAFAPIPNVQATTDIVLITGYAVGGGPGFAVGALGALVSNVWLGQGPWTPWEMAGWGLVGVGGAALAALTGRRLGRLGLAVACALAGLAYGALLDYSVMATSGGPQTLERYLAISARGIPFNVAHAVGNFVLALAAGPALVRIIRRYRDRFEWTWRREWVAPVAMAALVAASVGAGAARAESGSTSVGWLAKARHHNGGWGVTRGARPSPEMTGWAMLGLEAAGRNPRDYGRRATPVSYLRRHAGQIRSTGDLERTILALEGAGVNPRKFAGRNLVFQLHNRRRHGGTYGGEVNLTAFAILALRSAGRPVHSLRASRRWLQRARNRGGGWGFQRGVASDPDSTGAALQGLAAAGAGKRALRRGVHYLNHDQNRDGGWPLGGRGPSNSQSTAWAVQGLVAAGTNPEAIRAGSRSGLDYLASRRAGDGHYRYSKSSNQTPVWVTGQVLMAANREALPVPAVARAPRHRGGGGSSGGTSSGGTGGASSGAGGGGSTTPVTSSTSQSSSPVTSSGAATAGAASHSAGGGAAKKGSTKKGKAAKSKPKQTHSKKPTAKKSSHAAAPAGGGTTAPSAPAPTGTAAPASDASATSGGGDSGIPVWAYVLGGVTLVALLGVGGVWWYRSGGWVPPMPHLR